MSLPQIIDAATPAGTDSLKAGDDQIRALKQFLIDVFGLPSSPTQITAPVFTVAADGTVTIAQGGPALSLTNNTGATLVAGDVVGYDTTLDSAAALSDFLGSLVPFAVARGTIGTGVVGSFVAVGIAMCKAQGAIARGEFIKKSATTKAVETTGVTEASATSMPNGTIGMALTAAAGGFVTAIMFGFTVSTGTGIQYARVTNSATISLPDNVEKAMPFDTERWDTGSFHDNVTNNTRLTITTPGVYRVGGHLEQTTTAFQYAGIRLNGSGGQYLARNDGDRRSSVSTEWKFAAADYVELIAYQNSSGSKTIAKTNSTSPEFWISGPFAT